MPRTDPIEVAAAAVRAEKASHDAWQDDLAARDDAVRAAYEANPGMGPTALAAAVGLGPSTVRAITRDLARERRRTRE